MWSVRYGGRKAEEEKFFVHIMPMMEYPRIYSHYGPFDTEEEAMDWACDHLPDVEPNQWFCMRQVVEPDQLQEDD